MKLPIAHALKILVTFVVITVILGAISLLLGRDPQWVQGLSVALSSWLLFCVAFDKGVEYGRATK